MVMLELTLPLPTYMYPLVVLASNELCVGSPTLCFFNGLYILASYMVCIQIYIVKTLLCKLIIVC